ncbi:MAG: hypothetical protein Q9206_002542 [Seirophora lacunosa]
MTIPHLRTEGDHSPPKPVIQHPNMPIHSPVLPTPQQRKHWAKQYRTEIAASSSSLLSTFAAYPLDSVKTRMQAYRFNHFVDCVQHTFKTEGYKGFWRAPMASVTLVRTISFSIYQKAKYNYSAAIGKAIGEEPLVTVNRPGSIPTLGTVLCFGAAGATAGGMVAVIACPFELTKLSAQIAVLMADRNKSSVTDPIRSSYQQRGTLSTAKNIILHRGVMGLYSGNSPTSPLSVAMAGGLCGLVSWACIYPIDSAKTHYQRNCLTKAKGQPVTIPRIQFNNASMYRGLGVSMARSCIINTIFFSSFEFWKKKINSLPDPIR